MRQKPATNVGPMALENRIRKKIDCCLLIQIYLFKYLRRTQHAGCKAKVGHKLGIDRQLVQQLLPLLPPLLRLQT